MVLNKKVTPFARDNNFLVKLILMEKSVKTYTTSLHEYHLWPTLYQVYTQGFSDGEGGGALKNNK